MMRLRQIFMMLVMLMAFMPSAFAQGFGDKLVLALADEYVDITTNFSGREVVVFGINETGGDLAVTLTGPRVYTIIRKKGQALGIWANVRAVGFGNVPLYYDYAVNRNVTSLSSSENLQRDGLGINAMKYEARARLAENEARPFHEALIRHKQQKNFFSYAPKSIDYTGGKLFKVVFKLPPDVPTGEYVVKAMAYKGGEKISEEKAYLQIRQVGFSAQLYRYAHEHSFLYGLGVVFFAVFFGYGAHALLSRR